MFEQKRKRIKQLSEKNLNSEFKALKLLMYLISSIKFSRERGLSLKMVLARVGILTMADGSPLGVSTAGFSLMLLSGVEFFIKIQTMIRITLYLKQRNNKDKFTMKTNQKLYKENLQT